MDSGYCVMAKLTNLKSKEHFAGKPVKKTITWKEGGEEYEAEVYVRQFSYKSAVSDILSFASGHESLPGRIEACICDENGKPILTAKDVTGEADPERGPLGANLTMALINVIREVNSPEVKPKRSRNLKKSGTS